MNIMEIINMDMSKYPMNMNRNMNIKLVNMKRRSMILSNLVKVYLALNFNINSQPMNMKKLEFLK